MAAQVYFVFTEAPDGVDAATFERRHDTDSRRLLADAGFEALRRFTMAPDVGTIPPIMYTHMALYTVDDAAASRGRIIGSDASWAPDVRAASFRGYALEEPTIDLARLGHIYLVFTKPPPQVTVPQFFEWYVTHMRENLTADGFDAAWRYRVERDVVDPLAPSDAVHAALYEVHGELPELRASLDRAEKDGRVVFPEWFPGMRLACLDCYAISEVIDTAAGGFARD